VVDLIRFGYYQTVKGFEELIIRYPQGWKSGNNLFDEFYPKSKFDEQYEVLKIEFSLVSHTPKDIIEKLREVCDKLYVTQPGHVSENPYGKLYCEQTIVDKHIQVEEFVYYYKKKGFNEAYDSLRGLIGNLSEETFARILWDRKYCNGGYNDDLIYESKCEVADMQLFKRRVEKVDRVVATPQYDCIIHVIATDIDRNMEVFTEFFEIVRDYIVR
jgi:hypothetical protein